MQNRQILILCVTILTLCVNSHYGRTFIPPFSKFRWLVTTHGGAIDLNHFFTSAAATYRGPKDSCKAQEEEIKSGLNREILGEKNLKDLEKGKPVLPPYGGFESEDMPSNAFGACFGHYLKQLKAKTGKDPDIAKAFEEFMDALKPMKPGKKAEDIVDKTDKNNDHKSGVPLGHQPDDLKKNAGFEVCDIRGSDGKIYKAMLVHPTFCPCPCPKQ